MARPALTGLALTAALLGCGDPPVLRVDTPLFVFNTYPSNGSTIAQDDLGELAVTFSADLGDAEEVRATLPEVLALEGPAGPVTLIRADATNVAYDDDTYTLRVVLTDPEVVEKLVAGDWTLTVFAGLTAADGAILPTDYTVRFVLAPPE